MYILHINVYLCVHECGFVTQMSYVYGDENVSITMWHISMYVHVYVCMFWTCVSQWIRFCLCVRTGAQNHVLSFLGKLMNICERWRQRTTRCTKWYVNNCHSAKWCCVKEAGWHVQCSSYCILHRQSVLSDIFALVWYESPGLFCKSSSVSSFVLWISIFGVSTDREGGDVMCDICMHLSAALPTLTLPQGPPDIFMYHQKISKCVLCVSQWKRIICAPPKFFM